MNRVGIGTTNGPDNLSKLLSIGLGLYLVLGVEGVDDQCRQIRGRYPNATILFRTMTGIGTETERAARDAAEQLTPFYERYSVIDLIPYNEIDLEEGATAEQVAAYATPFGQAIRQLCPWVRLHFPAFSAEQFYQDPLQRVWLPATYAGGYDVVDLHAYGNISTPVDAQVRAYLAWFRARLTEGSIPPWALSSITELNFGLNQPRPADYGDQLVRAFEAIRAEPNCQGGAVFIWTWRNPQPGGAALEVANDPGAIDGLRRAVQQADQTPPPRDPLPPESEPQPEEPMPVENVVTADTRVDIADLINAAAAKYDVDPITLLALMIAESNLYTGPKARRERTYPDVSYGLIQQTVWTIHPDTGLPVTRGADGLALDTPENRRIVRDWLEVPDNAIDYAARRLAELAVRWKETEPLRLLSRWNAPAWTLEENAARQPESIRNYQRGLAEAERYRVGAQQEDIMPRPQPPAGIVWIGTPHFEQGRAGRRPLAIVNHVAEGSLAGVDSWFQNPASQVSAHFCVGFDGAIHQYVTTSNTAWANGRVNRPNLAIPWLAEAVNTGTNPNTLTISIEREGFSREPLSEAMYQSILALHRYLCAYWNIPIDREHIIGHNAIDSIDRANCPGPYFPRDRLLTDLNASAEPPVGEEDDMPLTTFDGPAAGLTADELTRLESDLNASWGYADRSGDAKRREQAQRGIIAVKRALLGKP